MKAKKTYDREVMEGKEMIAANLKQIKVVLARLDFYIGVEKADIEDLYARLEFANPTPEAYEFDKKIGKQLIKMEKYAARLVKEFKMFRSCRQNRAKSRIRKLVEDIKVLIAKR